MRPAPEFGGVSNLGKGKTRGELAAPAAPRATTRNARSKRTLHCANKQLTCPRGLRAEATEQGLVPTRETRAPSRDAAMHVTQEVEWIFRLAGETFSLNSFP